MIIEKCAMLLQGEGPAAEHAGVRDERLSAAPKNAKSRGGEQASERPDPPPESRSRRHLNESK